MIEYRSIRDLNQTILKNLHRVPRDIDVIVGIPRSGLLAANMLALHLNLPLTDVRGLIERRVFEGGVRSKVGEAKLNSLDRLKALVLDDSVDTGWQIRQTKARIEASGFNFDSVFGAIYANPYSAHNVDIHFEIVPQPRLFEWNLLHHNILERSCVDIDGVLCRDPTEEENDDGPNYREFVANVEPLFVPSVPIGWLVTSRLEKYRQLTEHWLDRHGVIYGELVMMNLPSKAARIAAGRYSKFKSDIYAATDAQLFIESSPLQAREIAMVTRRAVFCMATRQMVASNMVASTQTYLGIDDKCLGLRAGDYHHRAFQNYLYGRAALGRQELSQALALDPDYASRLWEFPEKLKEEFLSSASSSKRPAHQIVSSAIHAFRHWPKELLMSETWKTDTLGQICEHYLFRSYMKRDMKSTRYCWLQAVRYRPLLLLNRGILSIGIEVFTGQKFANSLRRGLRSLSRD